MHEASIAQNIVEAIEERVLSGQIQGKICSIQVRVGRFTAVIPEHLRFMFEMATQETPLQGVTLDIEEVPIRVRCRSCENEQELDEPAFSCARCGAPNLEILGGRELLIDTVEVE